MVDETDNEIPLENFDGGDLSIWDEENQRWVEINLFGMPEYIDDHVYGKCFFGGIDIEITFNQETDFDFQRCRDILGLVNPETACKYNHSQLMSLDKM